MVALKLVYPPPRRPLHAAHVLRADQHRQDVADSPGQIRPKFPGVVRLDQALQAPVANAPYLHKELYGTTGRMSSLTKLGNLPYTPRYRACTASSASSSALVPVQTLRPRSIR